MIEWPPRCCWQFDTVHKDLVSPSNTQHSGYYSYQYKAYVGHPRCVCVFFFLNHFYILLLLSINLFQGGNTIRHVCNTKREGSPLKKTPVSIYTYSFMTNLSTSSLTNQVRRRSQSVAVDKRKKKNLFKSKVCIEDKRKNKI